LYNWSSFSELLQVGSSPPKEFVEIIT